jgi:Domain of unknown function (DUF4349)
MTPLKHVTWLLGLCLFGCAEEPAAQDYSKAVTRVEAAAPAPAAKAARFAVPSAGEKTRSPLDSTAILAIEGMETTLVAFQPGATAPPAIARKIIYDAQVDLVVESVEPAAKKVTALAQEARGYIAEQNISGSPGSARSIHWRIRVPVERFESFVESIVALGELERNNRTSQDVTEQYYDLEARIKNKKVEEQTLHKILQERSGKLEDVLKIEIELSRVRGEIEQFEGKIRVLESLASLATIVLNVRERDKYAPPPPVVASFTSQIARTWDASIVGLLDHGKALLLWAVSWVIWAPFWLVGGIILWLALRILARMIKRNLAHWIALARTPLTRPRTPAAGE